MTHRPTPRGRPRALRFGGSLRAACFACTAVTIASGLGSCTTRTVTEVEIRAVEILPGAPAVTEGATVQLNATVSDDRGTPITQAVVVWSSDDTTIATVDESGRATGRSAGSTAIRASFRGVFGAASITVDPGPSISARPDSVALFGPRGSSPQATVLIENGGVGTLGQLQATVEYEGTASGWLPVSSTGTTAPATLTMTAATSGLEVGSYRATVVVSAIAGNSPLEIPVSLMATETAPTTTLPPAALTSEGIAGRAPPAPLVVEVDNAGGGSLTELSASVWYLGSTAGWLSASIASSSAPTQLAVFADATNLVAGTYLGEVRVASPVAVNDPEPLPITFVVAPAPESADVVLSASGPPKATSGEKIDYVTTVLNAGPDTAQGVVVTNAIPAGTSFVSSSAGSFAAGVVTWEVGALPPASFASVTVSVKVDAQVTGVLVYSASVMSTSADPNAGNNSASVTTTASAPLSSDVFVTKSAPPSAPAGSRITYTLSAGNAGPDDATAVIVVDTLPVGTTFVSSTGGSRAGRVVTWTVGNLAAGASRQIDIVANIGATVSGQLVNRAHASSIVPDPVPGNDSASVTTVVLTSDQADVSVAVAGPSSAAPGEVIRYDVTVTNHGPARARPVEVSNAIPDQTSFVLTTRGKFSNGVVSWKHNDVKSGESFTTSIFVRVAANASGSITDTAVAFESSADPYQANNTGAVTTSIR